MNLLECIKSNLDHYTGSIVLTDLTENVVNRFIVFGQKAIGKRNVNPTFWPAHVALILDYNPRTIWDSLIIEANIAGVCISSLSRYRTKDAEVRLLRNLNLSLEQRFNIIKHALSLLGHGYGYIDYIWFTLDATIGKVLHKPKWYFSKKRNNTRYVICSELVAYAYYRGAKIKFREYLGSKGYGKTLKPSIVTPLDIWNVQGESDKWVVEQL